MHHRCSGLRHVLLGPAVFVAVGLYLVSVPAAHATVAGTYCEKVFLNSGETCVHQIEHLFIETEGWSEKGTGNCNGVMNKSLTVLAQACDSSGSPPDEVYCLSCKGLIGWAFIHDHGSTSDKFTGWLYAEW
jgi:hypothetical protein